MPSFSNSALRLLGRLLGARPPAPAEAGELRVLDGNSAVAMAEASLAESAALGASFPADTAALAWRAEQTRYAANLLGAPLSNLGGEGPRGTLAAAIGLALSGTRATVFCSGPDLAGAQDLLRLAAGRRLPLVVQLSCRGLAAHAPSLGSGHEALHLSADCGGLVLTAANVQEAVDFTLIARRVAEQVLLPVLVAQDGGETAIALQDVRLPGAGLVQRFLGAPEDEIPTPTPAQRLLFGERRRRLPRWHDPDRPALLGALQDGDAWARAAASGPAFLDGWIDDCLDQTLRDFAKLTGRRHQPLSAHRMDDARLVLLAQGAAVETAEAAADSLRKRHHLKVGVLGLRCLRPFPGAELVQQLKGRSLVCVLERSLQPLDADPPLTRELRAALGAALEGGEDGQSTLKPEQLPRLLPVLYGLGGQALSAADLMALGRRAEGLKQSRVWLGLDFDQGPSPYPKRQVLLDQLHRSYPELAGLGLRASGPEPDLRPPGALSLSLQRVSGAPDQGLAAEAGAYLQQLLGGQLRSQPGLFTAPWGEYCIDRLTLATAGLRDPGAAPPADLVLLSADPALAPAGALGELAPGGLLLLAGPAANQAAPLYLLGEHKTPPRIYRLPEADSNQPQEYLLGALCGVLLDAGRLQQRERRLSALREALLANTPEPERGQRLAAFQAGLKSPEHLSDPPAAAARVWRRSDGAPPSVRRLAHGDQAYDSLPRFWDQVGSLYRDGAAAELGPDPYLALGTVPPLASELHDLSAARRSLPRFDPAVCTGCGDCWSRCPDAAIGAAALTPAELLDAGVQASGASALRPLAKRLAGRIGRLCRESSEAPREIDQLLDEALARLQTQAPLPEERREAIEAELEQIKAGFDGLGAAVTEPLFHHAESELKDSGALLLLAVDPDACKGCGICIQACAAEALTDGPHSGAVLDQAQRRWRAWEQLPNTPVETRERAATLPEPGPLAAALLDRGAAGSMAGGDGAEPGSGARLALRLALAAAERQRKPRFEQLLEQVRGARDRVGAQIRSLLAAALPADELDRLAERLGALDRRETHLAELLEGSGGLKEHIDRDRLERLVDLARGLGDLAWRLAEGRQGLGRARLGTVISPGAALCWTGVFPSNPFPGPVTLEPTGNGVQLAAGLLEGQLRQAVKGFVLLRKAHLELERPDEAERLSAELDALTWRDLSPEEQAQCPSLLVVGDSASLASSGLAQTVWALGSELPLRLLLLADLDLGLAGPAGLPLRPASLPDPSLELPLLALSQRGAYIAQSALGAPEHLLTSLEGAFAHPGPALVHLYAPSPGDHGFAPTLTLERSQQAVASRLLPLFRYDPLGEGVFGSRIRLSDNPESLAAWVQTAEEQPLTPAHWALGETRFAACFERLAEDAADALPLGEWLQLPGSDQARKRPYVTRAENGGRQQRLALTPELARVCLQRQQAWRALQELAGLVTPFTERVRQEAEAAVAAERKAELDALRSDYEQQLAEQQDRQLELTRQAMRQRLLQLAGYQTETTQ